MKKYLNYVVAILFMAVGVTLTIKANVGVDPYDVFTLNASLASGLTLGTVYLLLDLTFLTIQILILKKDFKLFMMLQLILSFLIAPSIDLFNLVILKDFAIDNLFGQSIIFFIGMNLMAISMAVFVKINEIAGPFQMLINLLNDRTKYSAGTWTGVVYVILLLIGLLIGAVFGVNAHAVGVGTVVMALGVGPLIDWYLKKLQKENN